MLPIRLLGVWDSLRTSFWFVPATMAVVAIALSFMLVEVDALMARNGSRRFSWLYEVGPEGARAVLSAVATSMITVASLTFSITMLTLQLASSQFGHRLLRNFMRDRANQLVLGTFTSTFLYCLLVLRTIRGAEDASATPHVAVSFGVLLAALSIAVLIYFIHHVALSIRVETVLEKLAAETRAAIDRLYPELIGRGGRVGRDATPPQLIWTDDAAEARSLRPNESGYVQRIDHEEIMRMAVEHDLLIKIEAPPGHFVTDREAFLSVKPAGRISDQVADDLRAVVVIGPDRTPAQDVDFSLRRIVEIAQRALSPSLNDPQTATYCIDRVGEALAQLAERTTPSPLRVDANGRLRVLTEFSTFEALAPSIIASVARYALADADVVRQILTVCDNLSRAAGPTRSAAILALAQSIRDAASERLLLATDRAAALSTSKPAARVLD